MDSLSEELRLHAGLCGIRCVAVFGSCGWKGHTLVSGSLTLAPFGTGRTVWGCRLARGIWDTTRHAMLASLDKRTWTRAHTKCLDKKALLVLEGLKVERFCTFSQSNTQSQTWREDVTASKLFPSCRFFLCPSRFFPAVFRENRIYMQIYIFKFPFRLFSSRCQLWPTVLAVRNIKNLKRKKKKKLTLLKSEKRYCRGCADSGAGCRIHMLVHKPAAHGALGFLAKWVWCRTSDFTHPFVTSPPPPQVCAPLFLPAPTQSSIFASLAFLFFSFYKYCKVVILFNSVFFST